MPRIVRFQVKCSFCGKWRSFTGYNAQADGFVDRSCNNYLIDNPTLVRLPFKGWVHLTQEEYSKFQGTLERRRFRNTRD